jgi:hypothetical protein
MADNVNVPKVIVKPVALLEMQDYLPLLQIPSPNIEKERTPNSA